MRNIYWLLWERADGGLEIPFTNKKKAMQAFRACKRHPDTIRTSLSVRSFSI